MKKLKLGLPKGSLQEYTSKLFNKAGFKLSIRERSYLPAVDDPELEPVLLRAQELSRYVESGVLDCGITGEDWIRENASKVVKVAQLLYAKRGLGVVRWVLAVPSDSSIKEAKDLEGRRIATELVNVTKKYLKAHNVKAKVEFSWGATEVKVGAGLVDAVVELVETGQSLKAHNLREVCTICNSNPQLIANELSWRNSWKKRKIRQLALLLKGALDAERLVGLKMNVSRKNLDKVISLLPALRKPTISNLSQKNWYAVETVISGRSAKDLIPKLKEEGAEGIIEYALNKVIY